MGRVIRLYVYGVTDRHWPVSIFSCWGQVLELREMYPKAPFIYMWDSEKSGNVYWHGTAHGMHGWQHANPPKDIELLNMLLGE